jgi:hypothetical protein
MFTLLWGEGEEFSMGNEMDRTKIEQHKHHIYKIQVYNPKCWKSSRETLARH